MTAANTYVMVLRPFVGERRFERGEVVDASGWRTREALIRLRHVREATPEELLAATTSSKKGKRDAQQA